MFDPGDGTVTTSRPILLVVPFCGARASGRVAGEGNSMAKWRLEFYRERTRNLARYVVEAPTPAAALGLGRRALVAEYSPTTNGPARSLFDQAQRVGGLDADGWVLYRIANDTETRQA